MHAITLSRLIQAPPDVIYRAISTPAGLRTWCAHAAQIDVRPGGHFFTWSETGYQCSGTFTEVKENAGLSLDVHTPYAGRQRFTIKPLDDESQVSMTLEGEDSLEPQIVFWDAALNNLKSVLETGLDRRIYDRPMLGILIAGLLSPDEQARYECPVDYGIIVSGTIPGMGAESLGLQANDILAEVNGSQIRDFSVLQQLLKPFKAGDPVEAAWYRGPEKRTGRLTLSGRSAPHVPAGPVELAEIAQQLYRGLDNDLAALLEGVSEDAAEYRTSDDEWNIKEVLAHLILSERAGLFWAAGMMNGQVYENWATNDAPAVKALVEIFPSVPELVAELHRCEEQTVAMLRRMPPELAAHKGLFMELVTSFGDYGLSNHNRGHYATIRSLLAAAEHAAVR